MVNKLIATLPVSPQLTGNVNTMVIAGALTPGCGAMHMPAEDAANHQSIFSRCSSTQISAKLSGDCKYRQPALLIGVRRGTGAAAAGI